MNILVTGGASGLGAAIVRKLAEKVDNMIYFTYNKSFEKSKVITLECPNTKGIKCDFKNKDDIQHLINEINQIDLDVLINNAYSGSFIKTYFHKLPSGDFSNEFMENIIPTIEITQACIHIFRKKKNGKIITVLTAAMNAPPIGASIYVANKAYLGELTKVWATENVKFNITSNSVSPTFMQTALTSNMDERIVEQMSKEHPLKKLLTVEEVADTIYFLTTASAHLNGVDIVMNAAMK